MVDICKFCKKFKIRTRIEQIWLILVHIIFFISALFQVFFVERLLLNLFIIGLIFLICFNIFNLSSNTNNIALGALFAIIITANIELAANNYKTNILWDGSWSIIDCENRNFEHKKGIYISLCGELTNVISMITQYFGKAFIFGRQTSLNDFNKVAEIYNLWQYKNTEPDFEKLDEDIAYEEFIKYCNAFVNTQNIIIAIQNLQNHINQYCPDFSVRSSLALLLQEMFHTKYYLYELNDFIKTCSLSDNAIEWQARLSRLRNFSQINTGALQNNVRNLIINLYLVYKSINEDYNFNKK